MNKPKIDEALTNEELMRSSNSQFDLVGRAIKIAEYLVKSGKATRDWPDNVASEVLNKIAHEGLEQVEHEVISEEG